MLPPVTYSIQRLPQIALEKIPMCDVRGIDLDALPLQDSQLEVQQLGRYIQTSGHLEEVHLHLQRLHDLVITQHELRSEHICLIVTKSVSRFARNVVDCIKYARDLRALSPPVGIYFETENINTLSQNGELLLTVLAAFAQDESVNKSISVAWGIRQRFAKGIPKLVKPYGYQNVDGKLVVDEEEAGVVIRIFAFYLGGKTPYEIAKILTHEGIPTPTGKKPCWTISSVTYILGNDRYCGDVIMQKSLCVDLFAHKRVRNLGQVERYRMRDVHPPLISKEEWREAKNRISMPDREAVILEEITGEGILSSLHPILFKEDIDV